MAADEERCEVEGCDARAWQGELCNLHALERHRSKRSAPPSEARLRRGKALLRKRARELGIVLDDGKSAEAEAVAAKGPGRKVRSPKG